MNAVLPVQLTRYFADSRLEVSSFTRGENTLTVRVEKEIGPETGILTFRQVSFLSMPTALPGVSMRYRQISDAGPEFWTICRMDQSDFDPDDVVFEIESLDGPVYFVVAKSIGYEVTAE